MWNTLSKTSFVRCSAVVEDTPVVALWAAVPAAAAGSTAVVAVAQAVAAASKHTGNMEGMPHY